MTRINEVLSSVGALQNRPIKVEVNVSQSDTDRKFATLGTLLKAQGARDTIGNNSPVHKYAAYELAKVEQEIVTMRSSGHVDYARLDELSAMVDRIRDAITKVAVYDAIETIHPGATTGKGSHVYSETELLLIGQLTGIKVN